MQAAWSLFVQDQSAAFEQANGRAPTINEQKDMIVTIAKMIKVLQSNSDLKASLGFLPAKINEDPGEGVRNRDYLMRIRNKMEEVTSEKADNNKVNFYMWQAIAGFGLNKGLHLHSVATAAALKRAFWAYLDASVRVNSMFED